MGQLKKQYGQFAAKILAATSFGAINPNTSMLELSEPV
jgi:hypothetical protein